MLIIYILLVFHKVGARGSSKLHLGSDLVVASWSHLLSILALSPVFMVEHCVG